MAFNRPRDARGRFVKAGGQSLGDAVARIRVDTSGMTGAQGTVDTAARGIEASSGRINKSIKSIADGFRQAEARSKAFANSDLGVIQRNIDNVRKSVTALSAGAAAVRALGIASANNINTITARFNVFLGSTRAATKELDNIRKIADATGQPFLELAATASDLLGLTKSYKVQVSDLVVLSQQLKAVDPTARSFDVSVATREFLSGNALSLTRRFEGLDPNALEAIVKQGGGAAKQIQLLSKYLNDLGFGTDLLKKFGDEGLFTFSQLKSEVEEAMGTAFMPLLKDFILPGTKQLSGFIRQLRETNPEILRFAAGGALIVAGFAPALVILSQMITAYRTLKTASMFQPGGIGSTVGKIAIGGLVAGAGVSIGANVATGLARSGVRSGDLGRIANGEKAEDILGERVKQGLVITAALLIKAVQLVADILAGGANLAKQGFELISSALLLGGSYLQEGFGNIQKTLGNAVIAISDFIRKIPGQEGTADSVGNAGLGLLSSGSDAVTQAIISRMQAQDRLGRGLDFSETQTMIDQTNAKFEDLQNGIVGALNAVLFPAQQVEQAGDEAANALNNVAGAANPLAEQLKGAKDKIVETAQDILKLRKDFEREQKEQNEERRIASGRDEFDFKLGRDRDKADRTRDQKREEADIARDRAKRVTEVMTEINKAEAEGLKKRQEIIAQNAEEEAQRAEDLGKTLAKIQEETNANVANAAARLDANAVFEALASGTQAANDAQSNFDTETRRKQKALEDQLRDLDEANAQIRDSRLLALQQQFADEDAARLLRQQREGEDLALRLRREDDDRALRLSRQQEDFNRQDRLRREALQRSINDQIAALAQTTGISQRVVSAVVNMLTAAGGHVTDFVTYVNKAVSLLGNSANSNGPQGTGPRYSTRPVPTYAAGGATPINRVFGANEVGMESAIINSRYFAMLSQPAQILNAQDTSRLLAGAGAGGGGGGIHINEYKPVFNDVGSYSPDILEGMMRRALLQTIQDSAALAGG